MRRAAVLAALLAFASCGSTAPEPSEPPIPPTGPMPPLEVSRPTDREIVLVRRFRAPREPVWKALTDPKLVKQWLCPDGWSMPHCEIDHRVGGGYDFTWERPDGDEFSAFGTYREILRPERIVCTEAYDVVDWEPLVFTTTLAERGGVTTLTARVLHPSKEVRDLNAQMPAGAAESYDRLEQLLQD